MGIRPLRISTAEEEKVHASTAEKNRNRASSFSVADLSRSDWGGQRPNAGRQSRARKNKFARVDFFTSVTDNVCKKRFFVPSVTGKIQSFNSLGVAAGDRQFFSVRNRERVQKTKFFRP